MPSDFLSIGVRAAVLGDDPRLAPRLARERGFDGLLFDAYSPGLSMPELSGSGRREFRHLLSAQSQQFIGLRYDLGPRGLAPGADVDQILSRLDSVLESAAGLLAPLVCVDLGPLPEPERSPAPAPRISPEEAGLILIPGPSAAAPPPPPRPAPPPANPAFVSQVDAALVELGRRADRYGSAVAFRSDLNSFAALERALRKADCPWFGVDLDPTGVLRDEWSFEEVFSRLGALIRHVRGSDAVAGTGHRTRPALLGRGDVQWAQLLADLEAADYRGWITLDPIDLPNRLSAAEQGRNTLAKLR